jgi:WD40 repeat protein
MFSSATGQPIGPAVRDGNSLDPDVLPQRSGFPGWRTAWGHFLGEVLPVPGTAVGVMVSPDGRRFVTLGEGRKELWLWDAATGQPVGEPLRHPGAIAPERVTFSPDGKSVLTVCLNHAWMGGPPVKQSARLWDATTGTARGDPLEHEGGLRRAFFAPATVVTLGETELRRWDPATGKPVGNILKFPAPIDPLASALSPDGKLLLAVSGKTAQLWNLASDKQTGQALASSDLITRGVFSPDGKRALTLNRSEVRVWETEGALLNQLMHPRSFVPQGNDVSWPGCFDAVFSSDGSTVLTRSEGSDRKQWAILWPVTAVRGWREVSDTQVYLASAGKTALTWSAEKKFLQLWAMTSTDRPDQPLWSEQDVTAAALSLDGTALLTVRKGPAGEGQAPWTARVWDTSTGKALSEPIPLRDFPSCLAVGPGGKVFTVGSPDPIGRLHDSFTGAARSCEFPYPELIATGARDSKPVVPDGAELSPDGRLLAVRTSARTIELREALSGRLLGPPLEQPNPIVRFYFSPDGKLLVTAGDRIETGVRELRLWDTDTGKLLGRPLTHPRGFWNWAVTSDWQRLLTASLVDGKSEVQLWETATGTAIGKPLIQPGYQPLVLFSPDNRSFLLATHMETRLFETATRQPIGEPLSTAQKGSRSLAAFSPDGKNLLLASEGKDREIRLFETATGRLLGEPYRDQSPGGGNNPWAPWALAFLPDSKSFLRVDRDGTIRFWEVGKALPIAWSSGYGGIKSVTISPDGRLVTTLAEAWTEGRTLTWRRWLVPVPVENEVERAVLGVQLLTGMELEDGKAQRLSASAWQERFDYLDLLGGPPWPR